jgi:chemotaxis protein histidine kinase CheA
MTQDITRWLTEIRTLQQQLVTTRQERDQAYQSAANWRQLYDAEAKQRREEAENLQATVSTLRTELDTLRAHREDAIAAVLEEQLDVTDIQTVEGLRAELIKALQACDRLQKALNAEKAAHAETRKNLTSALGEAIDALNPVSSLVHPRSTPQTDQPTS